eukprot:CAMPEP_0167760192 /NCGR_PEP_ID=MMETSP0110_2-20121227/11450_1 /TAXON_ID=629695 /ORGANISM="Gymnochlora sp., Strain CCMP2014" /LENGTH=372 /DNA_ID=CAMNT_0007646677 /DNA_START=287 /DNA_END=1405 /DNA_ORIENTATION=-
MEAQPTHQQPITVGDAKKNGGFRGYVDYAVTLRLKGQEIVVRRRYSQFLWLRACLKKNWPGFPIPSLPPKTRLSFSVTTRFLPDRQMGLERFLTIILYDKYLSKSKAFKMFLTEKGIFETKRKEIDDEKDIDELDIVNKRYSSDVKELVTFSNAGTDASGDNTIIDNFSSYLAGYVKDLEKFLSYGVDAKTKLSESLKAMEALLKSMDELTGTEKNEKSLPNGHIRFDLSVSAINWTKLTKSRPDSYERVVRGFYEDYIYVQGMVEAIEYRKSMAYQYKKCNKLNEKYTAKPPKEGTGIRKQQENRDRLRLVTTALAVIDKLIISYHAPQMFKNIQIRFETSMAQFAKDQALNNEESLRFWTGLKNELLMAK